VALAPADFYAYSRATGQPYPESPEERAQQAPQVLEFRRNQLKAPESSSSNPIALGLGIGLGLAGLGGAGLAARRMLRSGKTTGQSGVSQVDLSNYDAAPLKQASRYKPASVEPSKVAMDAPVAPVQRTVDISTAVDNAVADVLNKVETTNTLVNQQQTTGGFNVRQANAALESGEDQATGRVKNQLQRNEDLDLGQIEVLEDIASEQRNWMMEQDEPINRVAAQLPDGSPVDQTAGRSVQRAQPDTDFVKFSQKAENVSAEAAAQRAATWALTTQKSKSPQDARALQNLGPKYGLTQDEIFHRISASAGDYRPGSMEPLTQLDIAALLDPVVPTENVKDLLGTTLAVRGGRVGKNLDYEVMAEGGGMTERGKNVDIVGEFGSDVVAFNPRTGQFDIDTSVELDDLNTIRGRTSDYDSNAADYGDVEGPGGFVSTKGFKERTKSGTTIVPGQVVEATGAFPGSLRQEREIDRVIPARETIEGDPAAGWTFDPKTGRARLVGTGTRLVEERTNIAGKPIRVVDINTKRARPAGSYQGKITVDDPSYDPTSGGKLIGRYQPATSTPSPTIDTAPVTSYMNAQERLIQDDKGNWYVNQSKTKVTGQEPLRGTIGSDPHLKNITLDRNELNGVLTNAADMWSSQGGGSALERQTYLIQSLDNHLKTTKEINLSVLQPNEKGYLSSAAFDFINNIQPGLKETNIYVKPAKVNAEGRPLVNRQKFATGQIRETPIIDPDYEGMEAVPLPGKTKISGAGGVSVQEIDAELLDEPVTFFSSRIETAPQRVTPGAGQPSSGELGSVISRPYLDTQPVGFPVRSPGSFARTQNPYTGAAAAAMGPASRVDAGDYQYTPGQLKISLEPTSQRQLQERNQLALTSNLTPGGRVVRGALNLGEGMGVIPAGLGTLSESETVSRYGTTGAQLQDFGNKLMAQAAYKRGIQPGPTINKAINKVRAPGGSDQPMIPGVLETNPLSPRGYTPNSALDFYTKTLERDAAENYVLNKNPRKDLLDEDEVDTWSFADRQPKERMVRRQGRMVPLSQTVQPIQRNVFYQRG
jgi:hypothetical protein